MSNSIIYKTEDGRILTEDPIERLKLIEKALELNPDKGTEGVLLINQAIIYANRGIKQEAIEILAEVILDRETTFENKQIAITSLNLLRKYA